MMFFNTHYTYFLHGLNTIPDEKLRTELFELFKELLALYKGNIRYEKFFELLLGVPLDIALELPYKAYRALYFRLKESNKGTTNTVTKYVSNDSKEETLQKFKNGQIGFKYIWLYFKAWLKFKAKRGKRK